MSTNVDLDVRVFQMRGPNDEDQVELEIEAVDIDAGTIWVYLKEEP